MKTSKHKAAMAAIIVAMTMDSTLVHAAAGLPPIHKVGAIEYLSGGIGQDESSAFERVSRQWPLTLEFAVNDKARADYDQAIRVSRPEEVAWNAGTKALITAYAGDWKGSIRGCFQVRVGHVLLFRRLPERHP